MRFRTKRPLRIYYGAVGEEEEKNVLEPLAELAPALRHPRTGRAVLEMLSKALDQPVRRL